MSNTARSLILIVAMLMVSAGSYYAGLQRPFVGPAVAPDPAVQSQFKVFWEVWDLVQREYFDQSAVDQQKMVYGAIQGMASSLGDPNTSFSNPVRARMFEEDLRGSFDGIGVQVEMRDGRLTVVAPLEGSPGEKAGLRPGDVFSKVDGKDISNLSLNDAIALIRGPRGTKIVLTIVRKDREPFDVEIVRAEIKITAVRGEFFQQDQIAYLKLNSFSASSTSQLVIKTRELLSQNPKGLIFDLRNNPGGLLTTAVEVASQFQADGTVLYEETRGGHFKPFPATSGGIATKIPMVLLVNGGSASASEIVAGALQDSGRAILIGQKTFGKGTVQNIHSLSDGSSLRVTIARWWTPKKRVIDKVGLEPDIVVEMTPEDQAAGRDPQLERAKEYLRSKVAVADDTPTPQPVRS